MLKQNKEDNSERRTLKGLKGLQNQSSDQFQNIEISRVFDHSDDSNFKTYNYNSQSQASQQLNYIFDMTEKLQSVDQLKFLQDSNKQENQNQCKKKIQFLRYPNKRGTNFKQRKSKRRVKKFSNEEDERLLNCVLRKGPKFHKFIRQFPGKTSNMLKNRYYKQLRFASDNILENQNDHLEFILNRQILNIEKDIDELKLQSVKKLQQFPEAENILSHLLGCLSSVFIKLHQHFLKEDLQQLIQNQYLNINRHMDCLLLSDLHQVASIIIVISIQIIFEKKYLLKIYFQNQHFKSCLKSFFHNINLQENQACCFHYQQFASAGLDRKIKKDLLKFQINNEKIGNSYYHNKCVFRAFTNSNKGFINSCSTSQIEQIAYQNKIYKELELASIFVIQIIIQ